MESFFDLAITSNLSCFSNSFKCSMCCFSTFLYCFLFIVKEKIKTRRKTTGTYFANSFPFVAVTYHPPGDCLTTMEILFCLRYRKLFYIKLLSWRNKIGISTHYLLFHNIIKPIVRLFGVPSHIIQYYSVHTGSNVRG